MTESTITTDTTNGRRTAAPPHRDAALLSNELRAARRRRQLSQAAVAARLRRPTSFVGKYENGQRSLDVIEFLEVAEAIGFDPGDFLHTLRNRADTERQVQRISAVASRTPHSPQPPECATAHRRPRRRDT